MRLVIQGLMGATANAYAKADTTQQFPLGTRAYGHCQDFDTADADLPNFYGEFVYVKSDAARVVGEIVVLTKDMVLANVPDTANTGQPFFVSANRFTAAAEYGWVQLSGQAPLSVEAAVDAADPIYLSGASQCEDTAVAGKQLMGVLILVGSAGAFTKANCVTTNGGTQLKVPNVTGLYAGVTVSGTGVAASSEITDIDPGSNTITISEAMTANGTVTCTFTHTLYGIAAIGHPHIQGAIT